MTRQGAHQSAHDRATDTDRHLDGRHHFATGFGARAGGVANVLRYVKEKHYDGTVFYRVVKGFVIQMGSWDANGKPRGIHPGPVALEANNGLSNLRGTVAMARAEAPDSATAEFFINLADNTRLDHKAEDPGNNTGYAVFGQVITGMDVVDAIGQVPTGDNGPMPGQAPVTPIVVKKVTLLK